jgi:hypothetical protein
MGLSLVSPAKQLAQCDILYFALTPEVDKQQFDISPVWARDAKNIRYDLFGAIKFVPLSKCAALPLQDIRNAWVAWPWQDRGAVESSAHRNYRRHEAG